MRLFPLTVLVFLTHLLSLFCAADTLKDFLVSNRVPVNTFTNAELSVTVQGFAQENDGRLYLTYSILSGQVLVGAAKLIVYDQTGGRVLRGDLALSNDDLCSGAAGDLHFIDGFILMSVSLSPSAECLLVIDKDLKLRRVLYGFGPVEVTPGLVIITENMIHFAPVHPGRLQLADLTSGKSWELYPPKADSLRAELAAANAKHMPSQQTCAQRNDPCEPGAFDEDIRSLGTDGRGRFAFLALQSASHATKDGEPAETVASQAVFYVYQRDGVAWRYCEQKIDESQIEAVAQSLRSNFVEIASRCQPKLLVIPDLSTMSSNPTPPE